MALPPPPALAQRAQALQQKWGLIGDVELQRRDDGQRSWFAFVQRQAGPAFLKFSELAPELPEMKQEADALAHWKGRGAARLLERDGDDAFLLELCQRPQQLDGPALAALIGRIHVSASAPPFLMLADKANGTWATAPGVGDTAMVTEAVSVRRWLLEDKPPSRVVLLHGDFHGGNVLATAQGELVVIDPMPFLGDPTYDLAQMIGNLCRDQPFDIEPIIRAWSQLFAFEPARVAGWAFVKAVGTGNWKKQPYVARLLLDAFRTLKP